VEPTAETHILDFDGDLYGQKILLLLYEFIRPEQRFSSAEELIETVKDNIRYARTAQLQD
jgi:riboflavin kinase/FMN adenylyltransferase